MNKTIVAFALAFFASTASANITNSAHDFVNNGYVSPAPTSACIFCHVPHNAQTAPVGEFLPLWAPGRSLAGATTYYQGMRQGTINVTDASGKGTKTCLGCHITGAAADMGTTNSMPGGYAGVLGTDLSNDHPVGNQVIITLGANGMQSTINLGGLTIASGTSTVECASCHDVHNATVNVKDPVAGKLLRNYTGDFCIACHNK